MLQAWTCSCTTGQELAQGLNSTPTTALAWSTVKVNSRLKRRSDMPSTQGLCQPATDFTGEPCQRVQTLHHTESRRSIPICVKYFLIAGMSLGAASLGGGGCGDMGWKVGGGVVAVSATAACLCLLGSLL